MSAPQDRPEFDQYAKEYDELLADPIRDTFAGQKDFFHRRKWLLIKDFFRRRNQDPQQLAWLDVGCGRGELLGYGRQAFGSVTGCDPSTAMTSVIDGVTVQQQTDPLRLPFPDASFDFVTSVCVYHHVLPEDRATLSKEVARVLRPNGIFSIIEHNPWNPATRLIVSRTPVDANAILLTSGEAKSLQAAAGIEPLAVEYFLYLPEPLFNTAPWVETAARQIPLGGQYASFARKQK